jgi:hypothetical protein
LHWNGGSSFTTFSNWRYGQINLSRWLFFIKKHGKFYFLACMLVLLINQLMDGLLYLKSRWTIGASEAEERERKLRIFDRMLLSNYFRDLLFNYSQKTSGSRKFAKFEIKTEK